MYGAGMSIKHFVTLVLLATTTAPLAAQDRLAHIDIEADDAELDRGSGTTILRGNVRVTQDNLEIRGDEMQMHFENEVLVEVTVEGDPASLRQSRPDATAATRASAREMYYQVETGIVRLRGAARVSRGRDEFASDDISYDTRLDRVIAGGGESGARVQMTISPRRPADDEPEAEPEPEPEPEREPVPGT